MTNFTRIICGLLFLMITALFAMPAGAQSVLDPDDPTTTFNPLAPPTQPAFGQMGKWVRTKRLNWNTDAFKPYIYKGNAFRLKFPKSYVPGMDDGKKYPMVIMFHGLGEKGEVTDNEYQLYHGGQVHLNAVNNGTFDGYLLFMQTQGGYWGDAQYTAIKEIIDYMIVNNKLDPFRVNIHGLSAGGQAVWRIAQDYPTYFSSILPMSAVSIFHKDPEVVNKLKYTPEWLFQGELDGAPAPYTAMQVRDGMLAGGANFTYTQYAGVGHSTWTKAYAEPNFWPFINNAHKANPWALYGRTEFCPGDPINIKLGVTAGFNAYEWRKDGEIIPGATTNEIQVTTLGVYDCRVLRGSIWSPWSPTPVIVKIKSTTIASDIKVTGLVSKVLPAPDSSKTVSLEVADGYASYLWQKVGSTTTLSTSRFLKNVTPGDYKVKVTELYGCSSDFSAPFTVIDANGPNKPDAPINLVVTTISKTSLRLDWSDNPSPAHDETNFEIYQAETAGGPYTLIGFVDANIVNYTINDLTPATKLYFKVRAINNSAASEVSNEANGVTARDMQAPSAPTDLTIVNSSRNSISLSWTAAIDDVEVTQYDIYVDGVKSYVTSSTDFTVYTLEANRTYRFAVKARDFANNASPFSNQASGKAIFRGLAYKYYEGTWTKLPDFKILQPVKTGISDNVSLDPRMRDENIAFMWEGYVNIPVDGLYTFRTNSDDGSRLYLGQLNDTLSPYSYSASPLVDNDGAHGARNKDGAITLVAGTYPIAITYFNGTGGRSMNVYCKTPVSGSSFPVIPDSYFYDYVPEENPKPSGPSDLTAKALSYRKIELKWNDNSSNETGFEIYRSLSASGGYSTIGMSPANSVSYIDSTLEANTRYYYKIRAINLYGESGIVNQYVEADWHFDNNYLDASGNGRVLTPVAGPTFDGVNRMNGSHSIKFDGSTHYLNINTTDGFLKNAYSEKSILFWMKSNTNEGNKILLDIGGSDDGLALRLDSNKIYAGVASNNVRRSLSVPFTSNDWTHVALIYDYKTLTLYLNGEEAGKIDDLSFGSTGTTTGLSRIGLHDGSTALNKSGNRFSGLMDHFTICGTAIPQEVVMAHMNNTFEASNAKTLEFPESPSVPADLKATAIAADAVNVSWDFNATTHDTSFVPSSTIKIEAEEYTFMRGVSKETCSEGGLNVRSIDVNDWMDYEVNIPVAGSCTVNFRVATTFNYTGQIQLRTSDEILLATISIPKTTTTQTYTTVSATVTLPAGIQTLRVFAAQKGWNFNWFEIITNESTTASSSTVNASSLKLYRSSNTNTNYLPLAVLPANANSYNDTSLFSNSVYYYKIEAINEGGSSGFSNEDSAITNNNVPTLDLVNNQNMRYGTQLLIPVKAIDMDAESINLAVFNLPSFATFDSTGNGLGIITFNPALTSDQGIYNDIRIIATDQRGDSSVVVFNLVVNDNYIPVINQITDISIDESQTGFISLNAIDQNPGDSLLWYYTGLPGFATITNNEEGQQIMVAPGYADNGVYKVGVRVEDSRGGIDTASFNISVNNINPNKRIYINFNVGNNAPAPWNNTDKNPKNNDNFPDLLDGAGNNSGIGLQIITPWVNNGYNTLGATTGNNSGVYPDAVMSSAYFGQTAKQSIKIYGLNPSGKYNFDFFGSRGGVTDDRTTIYTIGEQSVSLNAAGNKTNIATLHGVVPMEDGTLVMDIKNGGASVYSYLNAIVIEAIYNDGSTPARPRDLSGSITTEGVRLKWVDAAYNETAYHVYRSESLTGSFTRVNANQNETDLEQYTDSSVLGNRTYYYTIVASNEEGLSPYSDTILVATPNNSPVIAGAEDIKIKLGQEATMEISVTDSPEDTLSLLVTGLPSFATFTDQGDGTGVIHISSESVVGTFGGITVKASDEKGAESARQFKIEILPLSVAPVYVNFNQVAPVGNPWNSFSSLPNAGLVLSGLRDNSGTVTPLSITLLETWNANNLGTITGNNSGVYPDDVMLTSYYHNSNLPRTIRISGLDNTIKYSLTFFGSRGGSATDNRNTVYAVGAESVTLNAAANTNNVVKIYNLSPDVNGNIEFTTSRGAGSPYAYLNSLVIESMSDEGTAPVIAAPALNAVGSSRTAIKLSWMNPVQNQTAVEIYRSLSQNGTYTLLATLDGNVSSYLDEGLTNTTQYFYHVRGVVNTEYTPFSNVATAAALSYKINVNFNRQTPAVPAPWNNTNNLPLDGNLYPNLMNDVSEPTGINLGVIGNTWSGENIYGSVTGNNSGVYPDYVMSSAWWLDRGNVGTLRIDGLNQSMKYSLVFFASRDGGGDYADRTTTYSSGGKSVSLNAINNTSNTVQINDLVPDENGAIFVEITAGGASPYGYLGAMVLQSYALPAALDSSSINNTPLIETGNVSVARAKTANGYVAGGSVLTDNAVLSENSGLAVYPNPFVDDVTIRFNTKNPIDKVTILVADISGRIVHSKELSNLSRGLNIHKLDLNGSRLNKGVYFIKIVGLESNGIEPFKVLKIK